VLGFYKGSAAVTFIRPFKGRGQTTPETDQSEMGRTGIQGSRIMGNKLGAYQSEMVASRLIAPDSQEMRMSYEHERLTAMQN
jgi:hypothetical protein